MENYYTAAEAAAFLGLEYHTFLARVRRGAYPYETFGNKKAFPKSVIHDKANSHAPDRKTLEEAAR